MSCLEQWQLEKCDIFFSVFGSQLGNFKTVDVMPIGPVDSTKNEEEKQGCLKAKKSRPTIFAEKATQTLTDRPRLLLYKFHFFVFVC